MSIEPVGLTAAQRILAIARQEVGVVESPANSNRTKYGKWFGFDGVAWCGMFVSWCYHHAGVPLGNIGFRNGFAGCQTAVAHFVKTKQTTTTPRPGDIVFFDWNGDGRYDHVGLYVAQKANGNFDTIEGNTSLANQSNGGQVMRRERKPKNVLFVHPKTLTA